MKHWLVAALIVCACGGTQRGGTTTTSTPETQVADSLADWMVAVLPDGVQLLVELDLARLRKNPVVGDVVTRVLADLGAEQQLPGLPVAVQGSPLANADAVVLGAYGVGTPQAATVIVLATKADVEGATRISADLVALGPDEWVSQLANRAAIAKLFPDAPAPLGERLPVMASAELMRLRDHAMPPKAPGAVLRVTARLSFDARVALARTTGLETAPAQLSLWADVVDDFAVIVDADAADPGDKDKKQARARMSRALQGFFGALAAEPSVRGLGFSPSLTGAKLIEQGTWVRVIITVGPRQLARAMERAKVFLAAPAAPSDAPAAQAP